MFEWFHERDWRAAGLTNDERDWRVTKALLSELVDALDIDEDTLTIHTHQFCLNIVHETIKQYREGSMQPPPQV